MTNTQFASLQIPTDTPPALPQVVLGVAPSMFVDPTPQIVFMSDEAKNVPFTIDPTAIRMVIYPSGRIDCEY
jgi:hypothetical protein